MKNGQQIDLFQIQKLDMEKNSDLEIQMIISDQYMIIFFFSKQAGFRVYPIVWDLKSKNKLTNLKKDLNGSFPEKFFPSFSRGHFDPLLLICEKSKEINHSTLPDASIYSNTFNKLVKINYLIRIYLNKIIQIFNIYGFKKGFKLIISKIKNIMKKND